MVPFRRGSNWMLCAVMSVSEESSRDASGKEKRIVRTAMGEEEDRGDALAQKVATLG